MANIYYADHYAKRAFDKALYISILEKRFDRSLLYYQRSFLHSDIFSMPLGGVKGGVEG